jgi:ligand-binding sensor domain-containing protein
MKNMPRLIMRYSFIQTGWLFLVLFSSCEGQVKTAPVKAADEAKAVLVGQPGIVRTQGASPYANIYCGLEDKSGNLWFGTQGEGVYRYDGKSFFQYTTQDGLSNNHVYSMIQDATGNIWFGTAYGLCKYDGKHFSSVPIVVADENNFQTDTLPSGKFTVDQHGVPAPENIIWSVMQDKKGVFWFGAADGVYCYNGISSWRFLDDKNVVNKDSLHLRMIDCMLEDMNGNIWLCSGMIPGNEGITRYDGKSLSNFKPEGDGWIRNGIEDENGNLYFATRHNGVCRFNGISFTNITEQAGIDNGSVNTVLEDKAGNIWIATELGSGQPGEDGGVWRFDGKSFTRYTTRDGLVHNGVFCMVEDRSGNIWFGTRNIGLCRFDGKTFTTFSASAGIAPANTK